MSDHDVTTEVAQLPARIRDRGMTLPELLIALTLSGLLMVVIAASITVTLRQRPQTEGRINLAKAEQSISMWLPNDLASAGSYTTDPGASPCGAPVCDGIDLSDGSNVLMLTWTTEVATATDTESYITNVSYNFFPSSDGTAFQLRRVSCTNRTGSWECTSITLLHNMPPPPAGMGWVPGVGYGEDQCLPAPGTIDCTIPVWVIEVSTPLAADATSDDPINYATGEELKDANRIIVTIDGGGGGDAASGGQTRISITAGGTNREIIDANSLLGAPSFEEARSRCGGPLTLIVDESNSINNDGGGAAVLNAVRQFVNTLVGTPVQIQIVEFSTTAKVLGTSGWSRYFNMLDIDGDVRRLISNSDLSGPDDGGYLAQMAINGGTNWEDALFRTFYNQNGTIHDIFPETVVFFTDGAPTYDRQTGAQKTGGDLEGQPSYPRPPWANSTGSQYSQAAFNRAAYIANLNRSRTRLIGVGVGGINDNLTWVSDPGAGYVLTWERGSYRYKKVETVYQTNRSNFRVATSWRSNLDYEYRSGTNWNNSGHVTDVSAETYFANNPDTNHTGQSDSDRYRIRRSSGTYRTRSGTPLTTTNMSYARRYINEVAQFNTGNFSVQSWGSSSAAAYKAAPAVERTRLYMFTTQSGWTNIDEATYNAGNYTSDETDGFRIRTVETWVSKEEYEAGLANPEPGVSWVDSGTKTWATSDSQARDWEPVTVTWTASEQRDRENRTNDGYRATREYPPAAPVGGYVDYTPATTTTKKGSQILANLIAGDDVGTPWTQSPDNSAIANMYVLPSAAQGGFSQLEGALKSVALGECGGTLTLQTKVTSGGVTTNARDPFTYQNTAAYDPSGNPLTIAQTVVTTNQQYPSRTFDFTVEGGQYVTIEIRPQNYAELNQYTPQSTPWSCRRGVEPLAAGTSAPSDNQFQTFPIVDDLGNPTGWTGIRIRVRSNSALACTLHVNG